MATNTPEDFIREQEGEEYPAAPEQLAALKSFLTNPSVSASDAAKDITRPIIEARQKALNKEPSDYDFTSLWSTIAEAVRQLTDHNDRLVELVTEIQKVPDQEGYIAFMQDYREHWTEIAFEFKDPPSDDPGLAAKRQAWFNINAFTAKLSAYGIPQLDERPRAAWVLKHTLEEAPWEVFHHPDIDEQLDEDPDDEVVLESAKHELETRDVRVLNNWVPAAALWMKINAKGIYEMQGKMSNADEQNWDPSLWKGVRGWSKERFAFWRERFEWISKVTALERSTRNDATEAAKIMRDVEKVP
ncbi:hypothetical protein QQS21_004559 [Conoideocrella luteorostrata]|uniref:Uncharacterized protein n=1 Tax=Conoideocrella luteorostrata TaxID=1105319 RepID=A0AAJ0FUJ8_9HYPO|nr:hypothetical protein QQS21_004559 [Conoideocrella luteorostrata]